MFWKKVDSSVKEITIECPMCKERNEETLREARRIGVAREDAKRLEKLEKDFRRPLSEMSKGEIEYWGKRAGCLRHSYALSELEESLQKRLRYLEREELEAQWAKEREAMNGK